MESFKIFIIKEDYMKFLMKNRNLTQSQRDKINNFYTGRGSQQAVKEFEKKIGWQSKKLHKMMYNEFDDLMRGSKAGRRELLKSTKIPGKKGKDYWPMKIKNKNVIANIPLNQYTSQFMNSCKYGTINVNYCIGWPSDRQYWDKHIISEGKVPIYITDGIVKWVVMIKRGNKQYEVWDKTNSEDVSKHVSEPISGFSIKNELMGSRQSKVYDEIRYRYYGVKKANIKDAIQSYRILINDILEYARDMHIDNEDWYNAQTKIKNDTYKRYIRRADVAENYALYQARDGGTIDFSDRDKNLRLANEIKNMTTYEAIDSYINDSAMYSWKGILSEYDEPYAIHPPEAGYRVYDEYFNFLDENEHEYYERENILDDIHDISNGGDWENIDIDDVTDFLENEDLPHPNDI